MKRAGKACQADRVRMVLLTAFAIMMPSIGVAQYPAAPPVAGPLRPFQLPALQESTLPNGLRLVVIENHKLPVVGISLSVALGSKRDPAGREGAAALMADLLMRGTPTRTAEQIAAQTEGAGASLSADADMDFLNVSGSGLSENAAQLFDVLGDVVANPSFPAADLDQAKQRFLTPLQHEQNDLPALASRFFARTLYGDHPYGRRYTAASISAITRDDLAGLAGIWLKPSGALLVVAGDVTATQARALVQRSFGAWHGAAPARPAPPVPSPRGTHVLLVNRPGAVQSDIVLGNLSIPAPDPRQYALIVGNRILGEGNDSRLMRGFREKRLAPEAHTEIARHQDMTHFLVTTQVRQPATDQALSELGDQIARLRSEPVPDSELVRAKAYLAGSFPRQMETVQQVAGQVTAIRQLGLSDDYLKTFRDRIDAVTAQDILAAAKTAIRPDSAVIVVAGDGQKIYDKLKTMGPVDIVDTEGKALAAGDLTKSPPLRIDRSQLVSRRDSFVVIINGNPLGTFVSETVVGGDSLTYHELLSIPVARWNLDTRARLSLPGLEMRTFDQTGSMSNQPAETHLVFARGRVKGRAQIPQPGGTPKVAALDTVVAAGAIDQDVLSAMVPTLPLEPETSYTISAFDASDGSVKPVQVTVLAVGNLGVPAGMFPVSQVQVMAPQPLILYITRDAPRRIVKIERMGQPMSFELVN